MEIKKAIEVVTLLADGIDPHTGEVFPHVSPFQDPDTVRALFLAIKGLEQLEKNEKRRKQLPDNAGKGWEEQEEYLLANGFDSGKTINELAEIHQRTNGAIRSRLVKLRKIEE
ncbi:MULTISPECIES: hypothetical protein [Bacillaceae]|uniref:Uncharacterized protein n=1 Tax=Evansella alkalicola TaxID=745819 RepID=A0ABS6JSU9_9BACI|nr:MULTISPECIES: hypothetical protein [Bacillaceae]MBU9721643.1 hypothetical protein [Bacillus alkalicola]